jgi:hypothetical protein
MLAGAFVALGVQSAGYTRLELKGSNPWWRPRPNQLRHSRAVTRAMTAELAPVVLCTRSGAFCAYCRVASRLRDAELSTDRSVAARWLTIRLSRWRCG